MIIFFNELYIYLSILPLDTCSLVTKDILAPILLLLRHYINFLVFSKIMQWLMIKNDMVLMWNSSMGGHLVYVFLLFFRLNS